MALTTAQDKINQIYLDELGRDAGFDAFGTGTGGNYWLNTHNPQTDDEWANVRRMIAGSDEGKKHRGEVEGYTKGNIYIGGIDPTKSVSSQAGKGTWGSHFTDGGVFEHQNAAGKLTAIANQIGHTPAEAYFNNTVGGGDDGVNDDETINGNDDGSGEDDVTSSNWWDQYADIDAFKEALGLGQQQQSGGVDDFMKFMMFMSMMRPQGGGGYGGSQYGYGGLNPGGVMSAYNPMDNITSAIQAFQSLPGIGTGNVNTGTATATS